MQRTKTKLARDSCAATWGHGAAFCTHEAQLTSDKADVLNRSEVLGAVNDAVYKVYDGETPEPTTTASDAPVRPPAVEYLLFLPVKGELPLLPIPAPRAPRKDGKKGTEKVPSSSWIAGFLRGIATGKKLPVGFGHAALKYVIPSQEAERAWDAVEAMPPGEDRVAAAADAMEITNQRVLNIVADTKRMSEMYSYPEDYILGYDGWYGIFNRSIVR